MSRRWILPAVLLVLLFTASLLSIDSGTVGVLRGAGGGRSFILEPGLHLRIPFLQRLMVYPSGPFRLDFPWEAVSQEGVAVRLQVHFEGLLMHDELIAFSQRAAGRNAPTVVRDDVGAWVQAWAAQEPANRIPADPIELGERFRTAARDGGIQIMSITVARAAAGGAAPATGAHATPAPARGVKVVLLGLDGADWQLLNPLIDSGKAPTLARLKRQGAWSNLRSMDPMLSPLLWTTAATGRPPEAHGVMDFLVRDPAGRQVPVTSGSRRVKALWNMFSEAGLSSDVVAWWATWPAEEIRGTIVSDRVAYSLFSAATGTALPGAVSPATYAETVGRLQVRDSDISAKDLQPFLDIGTTELAALRAGAASDPKMAMRDPVLHLTRILASTRTYQAIALDLLSKGQPDFFALYYQGIDEVSHRFAHYADPKMQMVTDQDHLRFRNVVQAFYVVQDQLLGEVLSRVDDPSLVLVLSDHGFKSGASRPRNHPPDLEGQPARWHRPYGIFLASGPMVAPGEKEAVSLLEVAPTVLAAAGLPAAKDMPGSIRKDLFQPAFGESRPEERIATYEAGRSLERAKDSSPRDDASDRASEAMKENLRSLGYISGGPSDSAASPTAFSHASLAGIHLQKGKLDEAEKEAKEALRIAPGYLPALVYLAEVYEREKRYAEALPLALQAARSDTPDRQTGIYLLVANLYVSLNRPGEGIRELGSFLAKHGEESDLHSALGIVQDASGDASAAEREYHRALDLDSSAQEPVKRLFSHSQKLRKLPELVPLLKKLVGENGDSAFHSNYLGLALDETGRLREAEASYRRALKGDPDHAGALANLGSLLARQRRFEEAIPVLRSAVSRDPASVEARVSLGAALSIGGRNEEAIATLREGEKLGLATPVLYNALALAYYQARQKEKAIGSLKASLKLDPAQSSARSLLAEWEKH
jgi:predicted AlkP superfamily phosphohydrolase/phosphomutase/predicted Zn-dependent protease